MVLLVNTIFMIISAQPEEPYDILQTWIKIAWNRGLLHMSIFLEPWNQPKHTKYIFDNEYFVFHVVFYFSGLLDS